MALDPLPNPGELDTFSHGETDVFTFEQREQAIQQAATLLWLATRLTAYTGVEEADRAIRWGLMDMAWSLLVKTENKTEINSPFTSERIGSYSYSKAQAKASAGESTGVEWFDAAIALIRETQREGAVSVQSETVFEMPYRPERASDWFGPDPSIGRTW